MSQINVNTIANVSGTTAITVDSSGHVLQPALPSFYVYNMSYGARGSGSTEGTGGSVLNNTGNCYATGTGRFTASVAGRYFISACIQSYDAVTTTDYNAILLKKNGTTYGAELYSGVSQTDENFHNSVYWNGVVELEVNDYLQVHAVYGARDIQNFFTGYFIG